MLGTSNLRNTAVAASKYSFENIFNINQLRAILRRVSLFVLSSFVALNFDRLPCKYTDLCKAFLKNVQF